MKPQSNNSSASDQVALVEIVSFTDPYCTWCWGSEPILGKIRELYGDQIKLSYTMGGLVEDIDSFFDTANSIGGANWYRQVALHWVDASGRHGMPVDEQIFYDIKDDWRGTYPASIAFKAAQLQGEAVGNRYLRGLRAAAAAQRRQIHREEVQVELAEELELDVARFRQDLESGAAEKAFQDDLRECRSRGVRGFPSFLIRNADGREAQLHGYVPFERFNAALTDLADGKLVRRELVLDSEAVLRYVAKVNHAANREIEVIFDAGPTDVDQLLTNLVNSGALTKTNTGNGHLYSPRPAHG